MASKRRVRQRECGDKKRHATQADAVAAIRQARRAGKATGHIHTYRCPWCKQFHWGHTG